MSEHIPVLLKETIEGLNIKKDGIYLDLTLGRAGHSSEILKRLDKGLLIGVDQDQEAIDKSEEQLKAIGGNYKIIKSNFSFINDILKDLNIDYVDGVLMDLGVSSPQFDEGERGFSYRVDAPIDMRMDQEQRLSAKEILNNYSVEELTKIFRDYGDEKYAYQISKNIVRYRLNKPIETTFELVDIIKASKPMKELKKVGHPAKQVFQALRIAVNDELNVLTKTLNDILPHLRENGGRLAVITFHSGEDRIVKNIFKEAAVEIGDRYDGPRKEKEKQYRLVNNKPIVSGKEELEINHRSASAKLRIIERK
ncbi:MAG: 16S rRNA (cytosine(1402)-N(4))-methyltransferase RsmH [Bacilli bacterium]|nr:16S rRNA (cytosine(1402)-N(4))-methyltransferase RsmH [Bacilli bacterium]